MHAMIRIGPAGWSYQDWKGIVYPASASGKFDPLEYLSGYFDTIEINTTYYRPAAKETAEAWVRRVGQNPRFRFTAKLHRRFTHERDTAWTRADVKEARTGIEILHRNDRLGALLLQFPWSFRRDEPNIAWLDDVFSAFAGLPMVVEVRHASWNDPEFFGSLTGQGIGFVNIDQPLFHDSIAPSAHATSAVGYIRVHGRNYREWWRRSKSPHARYDYLYSAAELRPWAKRSAELESAAGAKDVYVVTNNHYRGKAVANALMLKSMTTKRRVAAPPQLVAEYPDILSPYVEPTSEAAGPQ